MERTLVFLKPDAVQRGLVGEVLARFERKGLKIVGLKMLRLSREAAEKHYAAHRQKPFFPGLVRFVTSAPVVAMVLEGIGAVAACRTLMGATFCSKSEAGTIRGDLGMSNSFNLVHGSDAPETARAEVEAFFRPEELHEYSLDAFSWIYDPEEELGRG